jgi:hypothetical protein
MSTGLPVNQMMYTSTQTNRDRVPVPIALESNNLGTNSNQMLLPILHSFVRGQKFQYDAIGSQRRKQSS